ncbi:MAG TPA: hypothetical protein VN975_02895 [Xanthobacteraceae bacterium]|jgi:hypothetical protein|nr:hypothetical protein [Xanthobacteraceae bacterium]
MPKTLVRRSACERESRQGCAPRQRPIALVELIITAALALSTAVAVTAVSIGFARADVMAAVGTGDGLPVSIALCMGLLFAAIGAVAAIRAAVPRRN